MFAVGQFLEPHELQLAVQRVVLEVAVQVCVGLVDAVEVHLDECLGDHAVEQHGELDHAQDRGHELRDLAEHEVGRHLQECEQPFDGDVLPVEVVGQDVPQLGLLGLVRRVRLALHAAQLQLEPALEDADLGLEALRVVFVHLQSEFVRFAADCVHDLGFVLRLELGLSFGARLRVVQQADRAQIYTHFLVRVEVWSEERVELVHVVFQIRLDDASVASDHVVLPHFDDFDKTELIDERHCQQLHLAVFEE